MMIGDLNNVNIISHRILLHTMPFGSGWLASSTDDNLVDYSSVVIATALLTLGYHGFVPSKPGDELQQ